MPSDNTAFIGHNGLKLPLVGGLEVRMYNEPCHALVSTTAIRPLLLYDLIAKQES